MRFDGFVCAFALCSHSKWNWLPARRPVFIFILSKFLCAFSLVCRIVFIFYRNRMLGSPKHTVRTKVSHAKFGGYVCEALDCIMFEMNLSAVGSSLLLLNATKTYQRSRHCQRRLHAHNSALVWLMNVARQMKRKIQKKLKKTTASSDRRHKNVYISPSFPCTIGNTTPVWPMP